MAKAKKQKKGNLQKKKLQKKQARQKAVKRRVAVQKPGPKPMNMTKLKKTLKLLPTLVYEPEMEAIAFSPDQIQEAKAAQEKTPDQIDQLANEGFMEGFKSALKEMEIRFAKTGDSTKLMLCQTMGYFMEQPNSPACMNQIIVGLFLKTELETAEKPSDVDALQAALKEYDQVWEEHLAEKAESVMGEGQGMPGMPMPEGMPALPGTDEEEESEPAPFEELVQSFADHLGESGMDEDDLELCVEDAEALFEDYCEEKEIESLEELSASKVKMFLTGWFPRNLNPTPEDYGHMLDSMEKLFKFLADTDRIAADVSTEVLTLLEGKEQLMENLSE